MHKKNINRIEFVIKNSETEEENSGNKEKHKIRGKKRHKPPPKAIFPLWTFLIPSGLSTISNLFAAKQIKGEQIRVKIIAEK